MSVEQFFNGVCKQVNHGDNIVIRKRSKAGPPTTTNLSLMNIICPKMNFSKNKTTEVLYDELFAWEAREYVRNKIIGKEICFSMKKMPKGGVVGEVYLGKQPSGASINLELVQEGYAEVRKVNNPEMLGKNPNYQSFIDAENLAKEQKKGKWDPDTPVKARSFINFLGDDSQKFLDENVNKVLTGVVEYIRDGAFMQVCIIPEMPDKSHSIISVSLGGVRCPGFKFENGDLIPEKFANEAKTFVEMRMLQRTIKVKLFSLNTNQSFIGNLIHPNGDIAIFLLKEGLAKIIQWSLKYIDESPKYVEAESLAKSKRAFIWVDFVPPPNPSQEQINLLKLKTATTGQKLTGILVEAGLVDNVSVLCGDNVVRKFFLSSLRVPRPSAQGQTENKENKIQKRSLFESQYTFVGREFLRNYVGKSVMINIDYTLPKPAESNLDDRICVSIVVKDSNTNLSEGLVSKGLALVIKHRANDPRSKFYDQLIIAEQEAIKKNLGLHSKEPALPLRVNEVTGNQKKSKEFLPLFQRQGRVSAIVEYMPSASRLRLYCPKENVIITLVCAGVVCARNDRKLPNGKIEKGDPMGEEAYKFARNNILQRTVEFEVEAVDKTGGFIGYVHMPQTYASSGPISKQQLTKMKVQTVASDLLNAVLVLNGFAFVNRNSVPSEYSNILEKAESEARKNRKGIWSIDGFESVVNESSGFGDEKESGLSIEVAPEQKKNVKKSSKDLLEEYNKIVSQKSAISKKVNILIVATDSLTSSDGVRICFQYNEDAGKLSNIVKELAQAPPTSTQCANFKPTKGSLCVAKYQVDDLWYRVMVTNVTKEKITVNYIDFGNEDVISATAGLIGPIPEKLKIIPSLAKWVRLAGVKLCEDAEVRGEIVDYLLEKLEKCETFVDPESLSPVAVNKNDRKPLPTFYMRFNTIGSSSKNKGMEDLAEDLIRNGFVYVDMMKGSIPMSVRYQYEKIQNEAILKRTRIWKYGDCRPSD